MRPFERISEMLRLANTENRIFPATIFYNEGWLLRLVLDWFSQQGFAGHFLDFAPGARWYSEALLPSQFLAQKHSDHLAEGWTHADGVIGHVLIGHKAVPNTRLADNASQFLVLEAKLFSPLPARVTNAAYFDQAARSVACIAEVLFEARRESKNFSSLGFYVLAPQGQIGSHLFSSALSEESIRKKVSKRVSEYPSPAREIKEQWFRDWFLPTLLQMRIDCVPWEEIIGYVRTKDASFGSELSGYYAACLEFNRLQETELSADAPVTIFS